MEPITADVKKLYLEGPNVVIEENYGGLGAHFLETLYANLNKIHQIDTVTGITETNGSVRTRAIKIAHELRHLGIGENDIVLICSRCHADQTIVILACLLIGAIIAPINSELIYNEYVELVNQLKPKICFCDLRTLKQMERVIFETGITSQMVHFGDQHDAISFRKMMMNRQSTDQFKPVLTEYPRKKVAFILPTQGTTGTPKLVCLSHHFIYCQIANLLTIMENPQKILSYYPLSWVIQAVLVCLCFKVPVTRVLTGAFVERTTCKLIQELKIDHVFCNTYMALQLVEHVAVKDFNLSCLKSVIIGTLITTPHDIKRLVNRLPKVMFTQIYCTTEVGAVLACAPRNYDESLEKIGTVGKILPNCKIRIVDIDSREDVEAETSGELLIGSQCMLLGYFKNMGLTKSCTQNGYFKTGDVARYDVNGWIFIEGRIADMINVQGIKGSPRELEDIMLSHPFVKDAAVISNDREVVACVIAQNDSKLDESKLMKFIYDKNIENVPGRIVFLTDFPSTPLGQLRRYLLKQEILTIKIEHSIEQIGERT